jgi:hypothetical protein
VFCAISTISTNKNKEQTVLLNAKFESIILVQRALFVIVVLDHLMTRAGDGTSDLERMAVWENGILLGAAQET